MVSGDQREQTPKVNSTSRCNAGGQLELCGMIQMHAAPGKGFKIKLSLNPLLMGSQSPVGKDAPSRIVYKDVVHSSHYNTQAQGPCHGTL